MGIRTSLRYRISAQWTVPPTTTSNLFPSHFCDWSVFGSLCSPLAFLRLVTTEYCVVRKSSSIPQLFCVRVFVTWFICTLSVEKKPILFFISTILHPSCRTIGVFSVFHMINGQNNRSVSQFQSRPKQTTL